MAQHSTAQLKSYFELFVLICTGTHDRKRLKELMRENQSEQSFSMKLNKLQNKNIGIIRRELTSLGRQRGTNSKFYPDYAGCLKYICCEILKITDNEYIEKLASNKNNQDLIASFLRNKDYLKYEKGSIQGLFNSFCIGIGVVGVNAEILDSVQMNKLKTSSPNDYFAHRFIKECEKFVLLNFIDSIALDSAMMVIWSQLSEKRKASIGKRFNKIKKENERRHLKFMRTGKLPGFPSHSLPSKAS